MNRKMGFASFFLSLFVCVLSSSHTQAQGINSGSSSRPLITQNVNESKWVTLAGNTRPEANAGNDRGRVADDFWMEHMLLQLRRPAEQEQALEEFIAQQQAIGSPNFQQWINAQQFGERFGLAKQDLDAITGWLERQGFKVNLVYPSGMVIDFSGTARHVREAFQTEIHHLDVRGEKHFGNLHDPRIPAALAPAIVGVVSLHDFRPNTMYKLRLPQDQNPTGGASGADYPVLPADLATIYNLNPLFRAGYSGQGQTIVLIEDTNVFKTSDWHNFRSTFGLSGYTSGSFTTVHPAPSSGANNCSSPGVIAGHAAEAVLDAEWASAAAPSAAIVAATCADSGPTFGGLIAVQNLVNASSQPPAIMSISYGQCETLNGAAANAAYNSVYQQAATEGVSVFVAAGVSGAAGCEDRSDRADRSERADRDEKKATHGIGVNALASTPYNVAVGGTDFSDTYSGTDATYWGSTNTSTYAYALSYIPETPWNDSCAGSLLSSYEGRSVTYGSSSLCNDASHGAPLLSTVAGGGGPSGCATGATSSFNSGVVSGTCQGWPKPVWQSVVGNPNDGVRDTPDVSLFAANGLWGHYYVFCWSDWENGGAACTGAPSAWSGAGGTSFASPIMAGIQALVNQKAGGPQGNPNPFYYQLAASEYGSSGSSVCNSSNGNTVSSTCVFYDVTLGDTDVDCVRTANCYLPSGRIGALSTSDSSFSPAYGAMTGWDFASGIGSVNAANLVNNWPSSGPSFSLSASPTSVTIAQGASGTSTITVATENGFTGSVSFSVSGLPSGVTATFNPTSTASTSVLTLTASSTAAATGTATVTIMGTSGNSSNTTTISLTVTPAPVPSYTLSASPNSLTIAQGANGSSTITVSPLNGFSGSVTLSAVGLPTGVTAAFSPNPAASTSTLTLSANSTAVAGPATVTITGTSGSLTNSTTISLTVNAVTPPNFTLSASPNSLTIAQGANGSSTITVSPLNGFSGGVTLSAAGLPTGVTATFSPNPATSTSILTLTATGTATTGTTTLTISGQSGSLTNTTTLSLTVQPVTTTILPSVWTDGDIGAPGEAGSVSYANGVFTVAGAGSEIYDTADAFHFVYQPLSGDGTITARLVSVQGGVGNVSPGVMIRETLDPGSTNAKTADWAAYGGIYFDERASAGGSTTEPGNVIATLPYWVQMSRSGSTFSSFVSSDGVNWVQVGTSQTISMAQNVYVGLAVNSGSTTALATATFDNVSVNSAAAPAPVITSVSATTGPIGSQVAISGSNFGARQASSVVLLNGSPVTINTWSATSISITIPADATSGPLVVSVAPSMNDSNPVVFTVTSQPLPNTWLDQDVGSVGLAGSASYTNGTFTVNAAGAEIFGTADAFHFVYQPLTGDGTVIARVVSVQEGSSYASAGVMIRNTLDPGSANAKTAEWPFYDGIFFDVRTTEGGNTTEPGNLSVTLPYWVMITRSGGTFSSYTSPDGVNWTQLGTSQAVTMNQSVYVGLAVTSGSTTALATATFDNVSITTP